MSDTIPARVKAKTGTTAQWETVKNDFTPMKGEVVVYSDGDNGDPALKVGDGTSKVGILPFIGKTVQADWTEQSSAAASFIKHKPHSFSMSGESGDIDYVAITDEAPIVDGGGTVVALYNVPELTSIKSYIDTAVGNISADDVSYSDAEHQSYTGCNNVGDAIEYLDHSLAGKANTSAIPTDTSDLNNDSGFIIGTDVPSNETDPTVSAWAKAASKPSYTASEVGALPDTTSVPDSLAIAANVISLMAGATVLSTITLPVYNGGVS